MATQPIATHKVTVGNVESVSLSDVIMARSPFDHFPESTIEQWKEYPELMVDEERMGTAGDPWLFAPAES